LQPLTNYLLVARVDLTYNVGFAGSVVGFVANGIQASVTLNGSGIEPWQTISCTAMSDAAGTIHVRMGWLGILSVGFVTGAFAAFDNLIGYGPGGPTSGAYVAYDALLGAD